jgi:hypothetical protein
MKTITLASGAINGADEISIELIETLDTPPMVLLVWPLAASVTDPNKFAATCNSIMRILAAAVARGWPRSGLMSDEVTRLPKERRSPRPRLGVPTRSSSCAIEQLVAPVPALAFALEGAPMALVFNGHELPALILSAPISTAPIAATNPPASLVRLGVYTPTPHWRATPEEYRRERLAICPVAGLSARN